MVKKYLKSFIISVLSNPFLLRRKLNSLGKLNTLTILNLHGVSDNKVDTFRTLDPFLFEELLIFLKSNFEIICFQDLENEGMSEKPKIILSFDDGYKSFIDYAVPMLAKYKIKANMNIIPDCVESQLPPLNVLTGDFFYQAPIELIKNLSVPGFNLHKTMKNRAQLALKISSFNKNKSMEEQNFLRETLMPQLFELETFQPTKMMTLNEIKQTISNYEYGVHSYSHASMEFESDNYLKKDFLKCQEYFKNSLGKSTEIYAFPNGSHNKKHLSLALSHGYKHILLVDESFSSFNNNTHCRFTFHAASRKEVFFKATGGLTKPTLN